MVRAGLGGDFEKARSIHYQYMDMVDLLFVDGNPAGVKAVLEQLHICSSELRLPLVPITGKTKQALLKIMDSLKKETIL